MLPRVFRCKVSPSSQPKPKSADRFVQIDVPKMPHDDEDDDENEDMEDPDTRLHSEHISTFIRLQL